MSAVNNENGPETPADIDRMISERERALTIFQESQFLSGNINQFFDGHYSSDGETRGQEALELDETDDAGCASSEQLTVGAGCSTARLIRLARYGQPTHRNSVAQDRIQMRKQARVNSKACEVRMVEIVKSRLAKVRDPKNPCCAKNCMVSLQDSVLETEIR